MKKVIKEIELNKSGDYVNIYFLGDFHFGSLMFYSELFEKIRNHIKNDKRALCIFLGDTFELDSSKMRQRLITNSLDRFNNYIENNKPHLDKIDNEILPLLDFINSENCIGMLDGNHYKLFLDKDKAKELLSGIKDEREFKQIANLFSIFKCFGFSDTQYICSKKNINYLGDGEANIFLKIRSGHSKRVITMKIYHGWGNGRSEVYNINKLIEKAKGLEGFDIVAKAHTHKPDLKAFEREVAYQYNDLGYKLKTIWLVSTSSTRKYRDNTTDYGEKFNYNANSYVVPCLTIRMLKTSKIKGYANAEIFIDGHLLTMM